MTQPRAHSALEAVVNTGTGYVLALATQAVIYPLYGIKTTTGQDATIALAFTAVSLVRSYAVRRIFNRGMA